MIMKGVHKRMDNTSLPMLCGILILMIVVCIIAGIHRVVYIFKSG